MAYNSKYTGAEVDALLDKVAANDVISIDSALSTTSENPVQNKVVTAALNSVTQQLGSPSGDPMHYMYEASGATYNATDEDIPMVGVYGDSYLHKAKHWHLNELGDITNAEMMEIYRQSSLVNQRALARAYTGFTCRTNLPLVWDGRCNVSEGFDNMQATNFCVRTQMEVFRMVSRRNAGDIYPKWSSPASFFYASQKLRKIIGEFCFADGPTAVAFECALLEEVRLRELKHTVSFKACSKLSSASILYMIANSAATSAIVITLHADAYARAEADTEIQASLTTHPNVQLASA